MRSGGTGPIALPAVRSSSQNAAGFGAFGNRQDSPTIATAG
jgi:hypothetical protein